MQDRGTPATVHLEFYNVLCQIIGQVDEHRSAGRIVFQIVNIQRYHTLPTRAQPILDGKMPAIQRIGKAGIPIVGAVPRSIGARRSIDLSRTRPRTSGTGNEGADNEGAGNNFHTFHFQEVLQTNRSPNPKLAIAAGKKNNYRRTCIENRLSVHKPSVPPEFQRRLTDNSDLAGSFSRDSEFNLSII